MRNILSSDLGNKVKNYKITAIYFTLGNIGRKEISKLQAIQLVILCKTRHVKKYGYEKVLAQMIDDLKVLETEGLTVTIESRDMTFYGAVTYVIGDNLGSHGIGGFQESFSKTLRVCRFRTYCVRIKSAHWCKSTRNITIGAPKSTQNKCHVVSRGEMTVSYTALKVVSMAEASLVYGNETARSHTLHKCLINTY